MYPVTSFSNVNFSCIFQLEIFNTISHAIKNSTRAGGNVCYCHILGNFLLYCFLICFFQGSFLFSGDPEFELLVNLADSQWYSASFDPHSSHHFRKKGFHQGKGNRWRSKNTRWLNWQDHWEKVLANFFFSKTENNFKGIFNIVV